MSDHFTDIRTARNGLEAALATSECEAARAAWRILHHALKRRNTRAIGEASRMLNDAIMRSEDDQLIEAKKRYDVARLGASQP